MEPVLSPHARTDRTRDIRDAEPWLPAPEDGRPGEGQRLTPGAPHNGGRPPPPGDGPPPPPRHAGQGDSPHTHTPAPTARGWQTPTARSRGRAVGGGTVPQTSDAPHHGGRRPCPGTLFRHPHSEQRRPARAHAVGPVLAPRARTDRTRDTWVTEPWLPNPEDGRPGEGQRLTPDAPRSARKRTPRGCPSTTTTPSNTPTHQRTSHGTSAPHPLLLGTATQQWRNLRHHARHAPDLRRWTKHTRSSGRWDSETAKETPHKGTRARTPTWRHYRSPPREPAPPAASVPAICPAWKRGHCTGEG